MGLWCRLPPDPHWVGLRHACTNTGDAHCKLVRREVREYRSAHVREYGAHYISKRLVDLDLRRFFESSRSCMMACHAAVFRTPASEHFRCFAQRLADHAVANGSRPMMSIILALIVAVLPTPDSSPCMGLLRGVEMMAAATAARVNEPSDN